MVSEWKEYLWDVPEERVALWSHCQTLFIRYSFPAMQVRKRLGNSRHHKNIFLYVILCCMLFTGFITFNFLFSYFFHMFRFFWDRGCSGVVVRQSNGLTVHLLPQSVVVTTMTLTELLYVFQAGLFFLKHAESAEKDISAKELHELLLLSLQWLSGMITLSHP